MEKNKISGKNFSLCPATPGATCRGHLSTLERFVGQKWPKMAKNGQKSRQNRLQSGPTRSKQTPIDIKNIVGPFTHHPGTKPAYLHRKLGSSRALPARMWAKKKVGKKKKRGKIIPQKNFFVPKILTEKHIHFFRPYAFQAKWPKMVSIEGARTSLRSRRDRRVDWRTFGMQKATSCRGTLCKHETLRTPLVAE